MSEQEKVFEFARGAHGNMQELPKFGSTASSASLCDVRWDGSRGTTHLAGQTETLFVWKPARRLVDQQHQMMALAPDIQLRKVLHSRGIAFDREMFRVDL